MFLFCFLSVSFIFPEALGAKVWGGGENNLGLAYSGAGGERIPALGQTAVPFADAVGKDRSIRFQVAKVTQPLVAIAQLVDRDNIVVLGKRGGVVFNLKDHSRIPLPRVENGFYLDMEVPDSEEEEEDPQEEDEGAAEPSPASFRRPE